MRAWLHNFGVGISPDPLPRSVKGSRLYRVKVYRAALVKNLLEKLGLMTHFRVASL